METLQELGYDTLDYYQIVFPHMGIDVTIRPTAFTIFGLDIQWYGIIITFGLLLALIFGFRNMPRLGLDPDRAIDGIVAGIIGGIVGARAYYVAMEWESYAGDWKAILNTRQGGLAIYGGIIGAFLVGSVVCKIRKVPLLPMYDLCGMGFLIGQGIGRWGNFTNQEAFGCNTGSFLGMSGGKIQAWIIDRGMSATVGGGQVLDPNVPVHPCFLYESVWCLAGFAVLYIVMRKWRKFDGQLFLMYIGWYSLERFFVEGLRTDSLMIGTMRISQAVAAVCVAVSAVLLCVGFSRVRRMGRDYVLYCNSAAYKQQLAESEAARKKYEEKKRAKSRKQAEPAAQPILPEASPEQSDEEETENGTEN